MFTIQSRSTAVSALLLAGFGVFALAFVLGPVLLLVQAAWAGPENNEPGLTLAPQRVSLALETAKLVGLVLAIAVPVGVAAALVTFRTDTPARVFWRLLLILPAFVPLDLHATAWLATLGPQGLARWLGLPIELKGLFGAAWVHAMASISWMVAIVGPAASVVEAELEEDCLLVVGPLRTMWHVTVRRSLGAIVGAALVVAVQTAGEMTITDLLQVRTYAETVYTEFALAGRVGAATRTAVPGLVVWCILIALAIRMLTRSVPRGAQAVAARSPVFRLGGRRWFAFLGCLVVVVASFGVPVASLLWRAGLKFEKILVVAPANRVAPASSSAPQSAPSASSFPRSGRWSAPALVENVRNSAESAGEQLELSIRVAIATAALAVPLAWAFLSLARRNALSRWLVMAFACVLFAMPGPVLGIGIKLALGRPILWWGLDPSSFGGRLAGIVDEFGRTSAVLVWLHVLRVLPFAMALLWPVRRVVASRLLEAAAIDGAGPWARWFHVELPACRTAIAAAALLCAVLSIGELGGSVIVTPPGQQPLSVRIFTFAHHGLESHLAGICIVLLAISAAGSFAVLACLRWTARSIREER
jgi:iron(III) transport system permease protein